MTFISAKRRKKSATVHVGGKSKFPVDSVQTAKSALKLENSAKPPLTGPQKAAIHKKAASFGVKSKTDKEKSNG